MKKALFICLIFIKCVNNNIEQNDIKIYVKCVPLKGWANPPILEENIENREVKNAAYTYSNISTDRQKNRTITNTLSKLKPIGRLSEYDIRALIRVSHEHSTDVKTYYLNWDRKTIISENRFYQITDEQLASILPIFNCCCINQQCDTCVIRR